MNGNHHTEDPASIRRILEARARALARPIASEAPQEIEEYVVLELGTERFGVEVRHVREVRPLVGLAPVPGTPPFWAGLVNVRGRVYPVLDLYRYLDLPETNRADGGKVLLVSAAGLEVCLLADDVPEIRRLSREEIGPPLTTIDGSRREVGRGLSSDMLVVLDLEKLLADPGLVVREAVI